MGVSRSGGVVAVVERGGEEDQAEEEVGGSERRHGSHVTEAITWLGWLTKFARGVTPRLVINMRYGHSLLSPHNYHSQSHSSPSMPSSRHSRKYSSPAITPSPLRRKSFVPPDSDFYGDSDLDTHPIQSDDF